MSTRPVQALEKPLPQNIEAERSILGAILASNDYIDLAVQRVNSGDFSDRDHQIIFNTMLLLRGEQQGIDAITLTEALAKKGITVIAALPAVAYISRLEDGVPRVMNVEHYCAIVKEKARLRSLIKLGDVIQKAAMEHGADLGHLQNMLRDAAASDAALSLATNGNGHLGHDLMEFLGIDFPQPEHLIEGLIPKGGTVMIVAMPHRMKSFFTTGLALAATRAGTIFNKLEVGKPVRTILVQVEDSPGEVQKRLRSFLGTSQFMDCDPANLRIVDRTEFKDGFTPAWCERFVRQAIDWKADLVIFDVLRRFFVGHGDLNSAQDTSVFLEIMDKIRNLTGAALLLVHHENRKEAELMYASAGSYNLPGWAQCVIQFKKKTEEKNVTRVEIEVDNKYANPMDPMRMVLDFTSSTPLLLEALEDGTGFREAMDQLGSEWTIRDLMESLQSPRSSAQRRLKKWIELQRVEKVLGGKKGPHGGLARYHEIVHLP
jgi:hypothetical protein